MKIEQTDFSKDLAAVLNKHKVSLYCSGSEIFIMNAVNLNHSCLEERVAGFFSNPRSRLVIIGGTLCE